MLVCAIPFFLIQEAHPIKQGLKQELKPVIDASPNIQEAHPIKQGLKLSFSIFEPIFLPDSRGASNKTRIETGIAAVPFVT